MKYLNFLLIFLAASQVYALENVDEPVIFRAASVKDREAVINEINNGGDINYGLANGNSLLGKVILLGDPYIVKLLMAHGVLLNDQAWEEANLINNQEILNLMHWYSKTEEIVSYDSSAWKHYVEGRQIVKFRGDRKIIEAQEPLENAVASISLDEVFPIHDDPNFLLGIVYENINRKEDAIVQYSKAIKRNPLNFKAYNGMGNVHLQLAHFEKAIEAYGKVLNNDQDNIEARYGLAYALSSLPGECLRASKEVGRVMEKNLDYEYVKKLKRFIDKGCPEEEMWHKK